MNVLTENLPMLLEGTGETLAMVFVSALFAYVIGLPLGVALIVTDKNGLHPMRSVSAVLGWIVNIGRSIPFVILMLVITPLTRLIVGRAYGTTATIVRARWSGSRSAGRRPCDLAMPMTAASISRSRAKASATG